MLRPLYLLPVDASRGGWRNGRGRLQQMDAPVGREGDGNQFKRMRHTLHDRGSMRRSKVLSVFLPPETHSWVEEVARSENRTMSELIREALRTYKTLRLRTQQEQRRESKLTYRAPQSSK